MAIGNLIDNAIDFSPEGGAVRITLSGPSVTVTDEGPGIPDYALPRLGERFFTTARPDGTRTGSGLGLAIVKRVLDLHGGDWQVTNLHPGLQLSLRFSL